MRLRGKGRALPSDSVPSAIASPSGRAGDGAGRRREQRVIAEQGYTSDGTTGPDRDDGLAVSDHHDCRTCIRALDDGAQDAALQSGVEVGRRLVQSSTVSASRARA